MTSSPSSCRLWPGRRSRWSTRATRSTASSAAVSDAAPSEASCYQSTFPYLADPHDGYDNPATTPVGDAGLQVSAMASAVSSDGARTRGTGPGRNSPSRTPGPGPGPPDALVLDIGGDIGALIIYADESLAWGQR